MASPRLSPLVARGRAAAMEEESLFVSADEAEEGEAAYRDARRVGDGKGDGGRRAETGRGDDDAFEDASDAADDSFEDPIDTSNAPAASSGAEFVSGTDTDGGGNRRAPRAPPRARSARPGVATSTVTRKSRVDDVANDARARVVPDDVAVAVDGFGSMALPGASADGAIRETAPTSLVGDARRLAALAFESAAADDSETDSRDGRFASAGETAATEPEPEDDSFAPRRGLSREDALLRRLSPPDASAATEPEPEDDSFADAGAELDESAVEASAAVLGAETARVTDDEPAATRRASPVRTPRLDLARPPPLAPPLTPPSPLAPGSLSRARPGTPGGGDATARAAPSRESDGRRDLTTPATFRRAKSDDGGFDGASDGRARAASLGTGWGENDSNDSAPRSARSSRAEALLRDARRGSSDDASESSEEASPPFSRERRAGDEEEVFFGGFDDERERERVPQRGGASGSSRRETVSPPRAEGPSPRFVAEEDASARRASRRRAQREKYMAKLRDGFAEDVWMSPEEARRRAARTRRNAHSEPDATRRFDVGEEPTFPRRGALASDDGRRRASSFASRATNDASATDHAYERRSATAGERGGSSRFAARAAAAEEAARARFSREGAPETDRGMRFAHPAGTDAFPGTPPGTETRLPPGMVPVPILPHPAGAGPEAMLWQLQQQQQMVFQQMQQLQLAQQQQQQQHVGYGPYNQEPSSLSSALSPSSAAPYPRVDAFELVRRNAVEDVTRLVEARAVSVHQLDPAGNSLLMWACARGHRRLTKFLLKRGAAVNGRNAVGDTPLHFCLAGGHAELAVYLIAKGADPNAANDAGAAPYERGRKY